MSQNISRAAQMDPFFRELAGDETHPQIPSPRVGRAAREGAEVQDGPLLAKLCEVTFAGWHGG